MLDFILSRFRLDKQIDKTQSSLSRLEDKIEKTGALARQVQQHAQRRIEATEKAAAHLQQTTKELLSSLNEHRITIGKLEEALEATREELRTAKQITIPGLVEANQVLLARWEAETQIQVARAVLLRKED